MRRSVPNFLGSLLPNQDTVFHQLTNNTQLRHAYGSVLTVTMASDQSFYEAFRQRQINREIRSAVAATQVNAATQQTQQRSNAAVQQHSSTAATQQRSNAAAQQTHNEPFQTTTADLHIRQ